MYRLRGADRNDRKDTDHHQENDPKQMWMTVGEWPRIRPVTVGRVQLLGAELCGLHCVRRRKEARIVVLRSGKCGVSVIERQRLSGGNIETYLPLAHLEPDSIDWKRRVVAVVDRDFNGRGALHVRAQGCRNVQLLLPNLTASLSKVNAVNSPGQAFAPKAGAALRSIGDADIAAEICFIRRGEIEG